MDDTQFWDLISKIDTRKLKQAREEMAVLPLIKHLRHLEEHELFAFEESLSEKLFALDGAKYADCAGESGGSGDGFLYARCYVVAMGQSFYKAVKDNPSLMPKRVEQWCEPLLYAHRRAWSARTGNDELEWPFVPAVSYESFSNSKAWPHLKDG